jgi:hypothetical protein
MADKDPYADTVEETDKEPVPGLGDPEDDDTEGVVCMPADLVEE